MTYLPKLTLVLGGARSGKSAFAENLAISSGLPRTYLATGEAHDAEMYARIEKHKQRREDWTTIEEPVQLDQVLTQIPAGQVVLLDCLTLWLSNAMHLGTVNIPSMTETLQNTQAKLVCVSNEVGMGLVPETALGRAFRDLQGELNAQVAQLSDQVFFVAAGLPITLKASA